MSVILFKNGVYILKNVNKVDSDKEDEFYENPDVISNEYGMFSLYGERVTGSVDGYRSPISLIQINIDGFYIETGNSDARVVAYLNQIEQLGVDTFLENYKNAVAKRKEYILGMCDKLVSELQVEDDEDKRKMLNKLRYELNKLVGLLFLLMVSMNAGLDNQTYIDANTECENLISEFKTNADQ